MYATLILPCGNASRCVFCAEVWLRFVATRQPAVLTSSEGSSTMSLADRVCAKMQTNQILQKDTKGLTYHMWWTDQRLYLASQYRSVPSSLVLQLATLC